jgi:transposase-like protein
LANIAYQANRGQQKIMVIREVCPQCKSPRYKKNGHIHNGKQNHHCHDCGRQFVQCCEQYLISEEKRGLIERLLGERISLRSICRAVGVTLKWLLGFLVQCFAALPDHLHVQPVSWQPDVMIQRLEVEADELASFVPASCRKKPTSSGCGSPWMPRPARSLPFTWAIAAHECCATVGEDS